MSIADTGRGRRRADVLEDWLTIEPELPNHLTYNQKVRLAAERMGMTYVALHRSLGRSGVRAS